MSNAQKRAEAMERLKAKQATKETPATETPAATATETPAEAKPARAAKVRVEETREAMLARLRTEKPERYGRVIEILEVGKSGPTKVRIRCDDSTPENVLTRDIKVQDLFQVRFSEARQAEETKKARAARTAARREAKKSATAAPAASE